MKWTTFLLAMLAIAPASVQAGPGRLQWRTTQCQVQEGREILFYGECQAGFAYDVAVRAIKFFHSNGSVEYLEASRNARLGGSAAPECLSVRYTDGDTWLFCTVPTPEQLGIQGD